MLDLSLIIMCANATLVFMHKNYTATAMLPVQVDGRVESLSKQYDGPQPSDLCDLLEGEQFFAGFERGLDIITGLKSSLNLYLA